MTATASDALMTTAKQNALIDRNFALHQQFLQAMLGDEALMAEIPRGALLVFLTEDDVELVEANIRTGVEATRRGRNVYFRHLAPAHHACASTAEDTVSPSGRGDARGSR